MNKTFTFNSEKYTYETGEYNNARLNERAIEVPIAAKLVSNYDKVLEVGNVLSHYISDFMHTVVDMGDYGKQIQSTDILLFEPGELFDCAISISTLEHMESVDHAIKAVEYIKSLLKSGSPYLFTIPHGYNAEIDMAITLNSFEVDYIMRMDKRDGKLHTWKQEVRRFGEIKDLAYNGKSQWANTVYILAGNTPDEDNKAEVKTLYDLAEDPTPNAETPTGLTLEEALAQADEDELSERAKRKLDAIRRPDRTLDTDQLTFVDNDRTIDQWSADIEKEGEDDFRYEE